MRMSFGQPIHARGRLQVHLMNYRDGRAARNVGLPLNPGGLMKLSRSIPAFLAAATLMHAPATFADVVLDWNEIGLASSMAAKQLPPDAARTMAIVHIAIFDAVNAIESRYRSYAYRGTRRITASPEAAAVGAAHATLTRL